MMNLLRSYNISISFAIAFILLQVQAYGQKDLDYYKNKYPSYSELILNDESKYQFKIEKGKLKITQDNLFESIILKNTGIVNYDESLTSSQLVPLLKFEGYTLTPNDKKIPSVAANVVDNNKNHVFHDDIKRKKITFSNLGVGSKKILQSRYEFLDPNLLHSTLFAKYIPSERIALSIEADDEVEIGYIVVNDHENKIRFSQENKRGKKMYSWERTENKPAKIEENSPGILYTEPHIIVFVKNVLNKDIQTPVLGNPDLLFRYYKTFTDSLNVRENQILQDLALDLTKDSEKEEDKVKAIYYWVKDNIKYIAFESGYEGFIPREAALVLERKFGDCKDMSSIITALCRAAGIQNVNLVWIGTRSLPYAYQHVPTPASDNHMIAAYIKEDEIIYLDATDSETRFGLPSSFTQGKEALIKLNNNDYIIKKVPVIEGKTNEVSHTIYCAAEKGIIKGEGKASFNGLSRTEQIYNIEDFNKKSRFEDVKSALLFGNNKFNLLSFTENNLKDRDQPYEIEYRFQLENFLIENTSQQYLNLTMKKPEYLREISEDRIGPYSFELLRREICNINYTLDANAMVATTLEDLTIDNEVLYFHLAYKKTEKGISVSYTFENKKLILESLDFKLWNAATNTIRKKLNETITIDKK